MSTLFDVSILKTIYFNLHYFGIKGIQLPVLISDNVVLKSMKGTIKLESYKTANVRIGFDGTGICDSKYQRSIWYVNGVVSFGENVRIASGVKISCNKDAMLHVGKNTSLNINSQIICMKSINIGENSMLSWDILIMDSDFHKIKEGKIQKPISATITIGNNVWIGCRTVILKGCTLPNGCIVAANSKVGKKYFEEHCLISTNGIIKNEVFWER